MSRLLDRLRRWWNPPTVVSVHRHPKPYNAPRQRPWTGEHSRTAYEILHHLQYGPMTRQQLDDVLNVRTAGIHLPKLIERGVVVRVSGYRPYRYQLAVHPASHQPQRGDK